VDSDEAYGLINQISYRLQFVPDLSDEAVLRRAADDLINQISFLQPVEEFYEAVVFTVHKGHLSPMALEIAGERHSEAELLAFLARLAQHLDERRPWPRPAFLKLDVEQWSTFADAKPIARINRPMHQINGILNNSFDTVPIGAETLPVMILELRSGEVVALMGSVNPRSTVFALMQRDPGDPAEVIAHFCELTGFSPEEVVPLEESR
jgi:hypothetical protein